MRREFELLTGKHLEPDKEYKGHRIFKVPHFTRDVQDYSTFPGFCMVDADCYGATFKEVEMFYRENTAYTPIGIAVLTKNRPYTSASFKFLFSGEILFGKRITVAQRGKDGRVLGSRKTVENAIKYQLCPGDLVLLAQLKDPYSIGF